VAIPAARGFPGITLIPPGEESHFLSCLPVRVLLPSLEALETLQRWGIRTCQALAALPVLQLSERLGQEGVRLHELACGATVRSLVLAEPEIIFEEEMELDYAVAELEPLAFLLGRLLDQLCARLAARSLAASVIRVRFDLKDFVDEDHQGLPPAFPLSPQDKKQASKTYQKVLPLPVPMRDSKMLLKLLRLRLQSDPPPASIIKITMNADPAPPRAAQGGLFLPSSPDPEKLELTLARLANLVGPGNIGSPELVDTHRPREFRMTRFIPPHHESRTNVASRISAASRILRRTKSAATETIEHSSSSQRRHPASAFRIFRPALPAHVELRNASPARISVRGRRGAVLEISGPWRSSGEWWREDAWRQEEWDLQIRFAVSSSSTGRVADSSMPDGVYRVYYDLARQSWFVRGIYD
jgi:protein ImuB